MTRLQELLDQSGHIEEGKRQWQNDVMLQETESQASSTTERDIEESGEEERNESERDHKRPRGRPKSNSNVNANKEWSDEEIFLLIDAWREIDQLCNVKHPKYRLKDERTKNPRLLTEKLSEKNVEATIPQISKKMLSLKNHFSSEKRKVEASSKKSGSDTSDVYNPKWQFYRHLLFLKGNFTPRPTKTNLKRNFSSRNTEEEWSPPIKRDTRIEAITRVADSMADMAETIRQKRDIAPVTREQEKTEKSEDEIFGEMITRMIAGIPESEEKYLLKLRIQQDIVKTRYSFNKRYQGMPLSLNQQTNYFTSLGSESSRGSPLMSPSNLSEK